MTPPRDLRCARCGSVVRMVSAHFRDDSSPPLEWTVPVPVCTSAACLTTQGATAQPQLVDGGEPAKAAETFACGAGAPVRRLYPNGKKRPVDKCNRAPRHDGPHRLYDGRDFHVVLEWDPGAKTTAVDPDERRSPR